MAENQGALARVAAGWREDYDGDEEVVSMSEQPRVQVRRIYEPVREDDGQRVLVDRIWPRGVSKEKAHLDEWCKTVAPSTQLRTWYGHDPDKWEEFERRYRAELDDPERATALDDLRERATTGRLTLLTASKRDDISEATVLANRLNRSIRATEAAKHPES